MYTEYQRELNLAKQKLLEINFKLEQDNDYKATFGNDTMWKIDINGKWYDNYCYIIIRNESSDKMVVGKKGLPVWVLMKFFGFESKTRTTEEELDFIIKYKDRIFGDMCKFENAFKQLKNSI